MALRTLTWLLAVLVAGTALAQEDLPLDPPESSGDPFLADPDEDFVVLSVATEAQASLGGFRRYLDRVEDDDAELFALLDPTLRDLEGRSTLADWILGVGGVLGVGGIVASVVLFEEVSNEAGAAALAAGLGTLGLTLVIQALIRPGRDDLMGLIDRHDRYLGRR